MKKKIMRIMELSLAVAMFTVSLTGCGTQAKATDITIDDGDTIIVTEEEVEEDATISTEDEITETEIVGENVEEDTTKEATYTEHEYFFALDKQDNNTAEVIDWDTLVPDGNDYDLKDSVTIYGSGKGRIAGYTKPNIKVNVVTAGEEWYCISFPEEAPEYQLLLVKADEFMASAGIEIPEVETSDVEVALSVQLSKAVDYEHSHDAFYVTLDEVSDEMEFEMEFTIPTYCRDVKGWVAQVIADTDMTNYVLFYVEKAEEKSDSENLCFKVRYGRLQEFAK